MHEVKAEVTGTVWKLLVAVGDAVESGADVAILESMKMEIPVESEADGTVTEIRVAEGDPIEEGQVLIVVS